MRFRIFKFIREVMKISDTGHCQPIDKKAKNEKKKLSIRLRMVGALLKILANYIASYYNWNNTTILEKKTKIRF